jgi:hypothetical protein
MTELKPCPMTEYQCARGGSSLTFDECPECGGDGSVEHECFEDSCCCLDPYGDICPTCGGDGSIPTCLSSLEWCKA